MKLGTYFLTPNSQVTIPIYDGTFMTSENSITTDRVLDVSMVANVTAKRLARIHGYMAGQ